jgi:DNA-binding NarL/FixJ family response regulator
VSRSFRRLGWAIYSAKNADEVRRLARRHAPELIVLATDLTGESGWLTCEKLRAEFPAAKLILVIDDPSYPLERFAHFVGAAALVSVHSAPAALLEVVEQPLGV